MALVIDIAHNARLTQMIGRLEEARRAAEQASDRAPLDQEVSRLYREVGRYVHWLMRQDADASRRIQEESRRWAEAYDANAGVEPLAVEPVEELEVGDIPEIEHDEIDEVGVLELTNDSEASQVDIRLLDAAAQGDSFRPPVRVAPRSGSAPQEVDLSVYDGGEPEVATRTMPVDVGGSAGWTEALQGVIGQLGSAKAEDAVARIARATSRIEARWARFPASVQEALVRLVGSRIRRLQGSLSAEDEAELKLALGRLRRFSDDRDLALCAAVNHGLSASDRDWVKEEAAARESLVAALT